MGTLGRSLSAPVYLLHGGPDGETLRRRHFVCPAQRFVGRRTASLQFQRFTLELFIEFLHRYSFFALCSLLNLQLALYANHTYLYSKEVAAYKPSHKAKVISKNVADLPRDCWRGLKGNVSRLSLNGRTCFNIDAAVLLFATLPGLLLVEGSDLASASSCFLFFFFLGASSSSGSSSSKSAHRLRQNWE